jgi:lipoate synthase
LPLRTICEDAKCIADDIAESYHSRTWLTLKQSCGRCCSSEKPIVTRNDN